MKHQLIRQIQTTASSLISATNREAPSGAQETATSRALVPVHRSRHELSTLAGSRPGWLRTLDQARRQMVSARVVEDVLRPVGSGFVQALALHALQPNAPAPASPRRPLRAWMRGQLARRASSTQCEPASSAQAQPAAGSLLPADATQWRCLHVEVHTWATGNATGAVTVDIVAVSVTHDSSWT